MTEEQSKQRSFFFLSLLCFALADVADGLGPFFGIYLQQQGWTPDGIGFVMTAGGLVGLAGTAPMGAFADHTRRKRALVAASVALMTASCGVIFLWSGAASATLSKLLQGAAAVAIKPALNAITLGMTGQRGFARRLGVNEAWNHAGNAFSAAASGFVGYVYGIPGVFFVMACMGALALFSLSRIEPRCIDYDAARGREGGGAACAGDYRKLFTDLPLLCVAVTLFFFHLGNAAMLPLLGQSAVARFDVNPAAYTAGTVILAQATMICTALWGARTAKRRGYGPLFAVALTALPVRGCVAGLWENPWNIIPVQMLDGVGAGLLGVATPGLAARLLRGSGHVNLGLGFALTVQGVGAALSNTYGGLFAHHVSYGAAFIALGAAPCIGLLLFAAGTRLLPELKRAAGAEE